MRVNIYAEELTDRVEIISKEIEGVEYTAVRFYLELPVTIADTASGIARNVSGPFMHRPGDDDSSAVTFWGKKDLRLILQKAIDLLDHKEAQPSTVLINAADCIIGQWADSYALPDQELKAMQEQQSRIPGDCKE